MMKKLLLADDSITIQKVVGIIFATENVELTMTDDGDSAFEKALDFVPDLVIADVSMPGKDGFELCRAIKNEPSLSHTSVMLLPGAFDHFDEVKAQEVCADGWLTKPFESQALLDKVSQLLEAEPVHMAGVDFSHDEGQAEESAAVDETVLGLDDLNEFSTLTEKPEESPEDIWDAVSFEEEDLLLDKETEEEAPFAAVNFAQPEDEAAVSAEISVAETAATDEPDESDTVIDDYTVEDLIEQTDDEEVDTNSAEVSEFESYQAEDIPVSETFVQEESFLDRETEAGSILATDETETVDFSSYEESEVQAPAETSSLENKVSLAEFEDEAPLDLTEVMVAESSDEETMAPLTLADNNEELESMEDEILAPMEDFPAAEEGVTFAEEPVAEELISAPPVEDTPTEFETELTDSMGIPAAVEPEEESILDLSEADIVADEPDKEPFDVAAVMTESVVEEAVEEAVLEEEEESVEGIEAADTDFVFSEEETQVSEPNSDEEPIAEIYALQDESSEEIDVQPDVVEDDGFYFDAAAEEEEEAIASAAGIVSVGSAFTEQELVPAAPVEQVEQQLRALSEDELKDVVARVAGPMIEKMASELLEQIAWEVVPDLAEAMIKEEIRKIKQAMSN